MREESGSTSSMRFRASPQSTDVDRLLYFESFDDVRTAIDREKQLKGWTREKKIALDRMRQNPKWIDLSREWYERDRGPSTTLRSAQEDTW